MGLWIGSFPRGGALGSVIRQEDIRQRASRRHGRSSRVEGAWVSSGLHVIANGGKVELVGRSEGRGG